MRATRIWMIPFAVIAWALIFTAVCEIDIETGISPPRIVTGEMVADIEGNEYSTVIIGEQGVDDGKSQDYKIQR